MDQTAAGNISMDQDKNIDAMYKELQILKGSIKKLMVDIREEMNNAENPFLSLQQLQAPAERKAEHTAKEMRNVEAPAEIQESVARAEPEAVETAPMAVELEGVKVEGPRMEPKMLLKQMKETIRESDGHVPGMGMGRLEPDTIIKLMQWTRSVLAKNGTARFHNLLDAYVTMGYLGPEARGVIEKISLLVAPDLDPIPKDIDIKECVGDMYALFMILNPRDKNLDSRMLCVMLGYEDRTLNIL